MRFRSVNGVGHAVAAGIGLAPLPQTFFEDATLKLQPVLMDHPLQDATLYVVYVSRRYLPLKIRAFIDFAIERFSASEPKLTAVR